MAMHIMLIVAHCSEIIPVLSIRISSKFQDQVEGLTI